MISLPLPDYDRGLDGRQQLAADFGPGQTGNLPDLIVLFGTAIAETGAHQGTCRDYLLVQ